jgi:hypothetical protein
MISEPHTTPILTLVPPKSMPIAKGSSLIAAHCLKRLEENIYIISAFFYHGGHGKQNEC